MISVWPRYSCRVCEHGDRTRGWKVSRRSQLEPPIPGERAHQRKPNSRPSFIDANILFDLDAFETRHVRVHVRAPPGNNWPSERVGSPGTTLRQITEFQTHAALPTFVFFYYRATTFSSLERRRQSKWKSWDLAFVDASTGYTGTEIGIQVYELPLICEIFSSMVAIKPNSAVLGFNALYSYILELFCFIRVPTLK